MYKKFVQINLVLFLTYRANFFNSIFSSFLWGGFHFITMLLLTHRVQSVFGWTKIELLILTAAYSIFWGVFHIFFARNFERFSEIITFGELDGTLLKPADSQFLLSFWRINFTGFVRILMGIIFLFYLTKEYTIQFQLIHILGFITLIIFSLCIVYSMWYMVTTLLIWAPRLSNLVDFLYYISGMFRYPPEIFKTTGINILSFLFPLLVVIITPINVLIGKINLQHIFGMVAVAGIFLILSRYFWKFALRHYTSASS